MVKKVDRIARAAERASLRQQGELKEAAMQAFIEECRAGMPADDWERHFAEARRHAGETLHVVEHFVFWLRGSQTPITPALRRSIDAMLEVLRIDRRNWPRDDLRYLNYGKYWKALYGYE